MIKLVRTKFRRKILSLLILNPNKDYYLREIASIIGEDAGNCSRELKRFEVEGIVVSHSKGRAKYFSLNSKYPHLKKLKELLSKHDEEVAGRPHVLFMCESNLRQKLFTYILKHKKQDFYVRELADLIGEDPGNLSRELKILEEQGLLKSYTLANAKYYSLNTAHEWVKDLDEYLNDQLSEKDLSVMNSGGQPAKFLTKEDCSQLLAASDHYAYKLILILLLIGLRKYELENLTWSAIDFDRQEIRIESTDKSKRTEDGRTIPIHPDALKVLHQMKKIAGDRQLVFTDHKGRKMSKNYLRDLLIKTASKCGLTHITRVNILRHTFAAELIRNGAELATVKRLMGTSDQQVDQIYMMLKDEPTSDAINSLRFRPAEQLGQEASE